MNNINLENTQIAFTPSFLGNGWETSLSPRFERGLHSPYQYNISFDWLKKMLLKMLSLGRREKEVISWTTAIARMFL